MNEENNIKTPEETAQAVERMADRLEEMENTEGVFGEAMSDEEMDAVAGGGATAYVYSQTCPQCGKTHWEIGSFCSQACYDKWKARQTPSGGTGGSKSGKKHHPGLSLTWRDGQWVSLESDNP